MTTTGERLKQLMDERGLKQIDIINACKPYCEIYNVRIGRNDMSQWVHGRNNPNQAKISILAMALDVSDAWMAGFDVPRERETQPLPDTNNPRVRAIAVASGRLTEAQQQAVLGMIESFLSDKQ